MQYCLLFIVYSGGEMFLGPLCTYDVCIVLRIRLRGPFR